MKCFLQSKALTAIYSYQLLGLNCGSGQHLARLSKLRSLCIQLHVSYFGLAAGHSVGKQKDPGTSLHAPSHSKIFGLQTAQFGGIGRGGGDSNWSLHISIPWAFLVQSNSISHLLITQSIQRTTRLHKQLSQRHFALKSLKAQSHAIAPMWKEGNGRGRDGGGGGRKKLRHTNTFCIFWA